MAQQFGDPRKQNINDPGFAGSKAPGVIQDPNFSNVSNKIQFQNITVPGNQSGYKKEVLVQADRPGYHQVVQTRTQAPPFRKGEQYRSCPIPLLALLGLLALAGIVLGILFGFGIIGGKRGPFQEHIATRYTNVEGVNYQQDSITVQQRQITQQKWEPKNQTFDPKGQNGQPVNFNNTGNTTNPTTPESPPPATNTNTTTNTTVPQVQPNPQPPATNTTVPQTSTTTNTTTPTEVTNTTAPNSTVTTVVTTTTVTNTTTNPLVKPILDFVATNQTFDANGKVGQAVQFENKTSHQTYVDHELKIDEPQKLNHRQRRQTTHITRMEDTQSIF